MTRNVTEGTRDEDDDDRWGTTRPRTLDEVMAGLLRGWGRAGRLVGTRRVAVRRKQVPRADFAFLVAEGKSRAVCGAEFPHDVEHLLGFPGNDNHIAGIQDHVVTPV